MDDEEVRALSAEEFLNVVQKTKENLVKALITGDDMAQRHAEWFAKAFLSAHYAQVLDILDDAISKQLGKEQ